MPWLTSELCAAPVTYELSIRVTHIRQGDFADSFQAEAGLTAVPPQFSFQNSNTLLVFWNNEEQALHLVFVAS